jgi:hypothetical protein
MKRSLAVALMAVGLLAGCAHSTSGKPESRSPAPPLSAPSSVLRASAPSVSASLPPSSAALTSVSSAPTTARLLARFAGTYSGHGRALTMKADGSGLISYRVYKWCSSDPSPPCDAMHGNNIVDGGRITMRFTSAYVSGTETVAAGVFESSTDPTEPSGKPLTGRLSGHVLSLSDGFTFCAANTPPKEWVCGA